MVLNWRKVYDVIACCLDVGEGKKSRIFIKEKALSIEPISSYTIDAKKEFPQKNML